MRKIKKYAHDIKDEVCGAMDYAEKYVEYKISKPTWAKYYKTMAEQELQHAAYLHEMATSEIEELKKTYTPPEEMLEAWEQAHHKYIDKAARVRQLLTM